MTKLLETHGVQSDMQYFEMIVDSFHNGQFSQAYEMFTDMPRQNRVSFLEAATVGGWNSGLGDHKIKELFKLILK